MFVTNPIGIAGEKEAAKILEKKGFRITERNWRTGHLEVDLIAENRKEIVFAEVKARTTDFGGMMPEEYVDETKRKHMIAAANAYIKLNRTDKLPRFDIIGVMVDAGTGEITYRNHLENAFRPAARTVSAGSYTGSWKRANPFNRTHKK